MRGTHDNDNEPDTFHSLSLATRRVVDRLSDRQKQTDSEGVDDREADERSKEKAEQHRRYVDEGLKRLAMFPFNWAARRSGAICAH